MPGLPSPFSGLGSLLGSAAKSLAGDAFQAIARDFASAAGKASTWLWQQIGSSTAVSLGGPGFDRLLGIVMGIAVVVGMGLFVVQIIQSVLRRDSAGLARAGKGLLIAFLGGGIAIAVTDLLLNAVDALSNGVVQAATGGSISHLGQAIMVTGAITSLANPAAMLVLALIVIGACMFIWAALMIRKLLIVIAAVFAPAAFAGSLADISTGWVKKWIEGMAALIVSKLILVIMLLVGYYMLTRSAGVAGVGGLLPTATQAFTQVAAGGVVLLLAAFAPWVALKTVHFAGEHMALLHAHATSATCGLTTAIAPPQKLTNMALASRGGAGGSGAPTPTGPPRGGPAGPAGPAAPSSGGGTAGGATAAKSRAAGGFAAGAAAGSAAGSAATSGVENGTAHMNGNGSTPNAPPSSDRPSGAPPSRPSPPASSPPPGPGPVPPRSN